MKFFSRNDSAGFLSKLMFPSLILAPFVFYLLMCQDFVSGRITINSDTYAHYTFIKYYANNLLTGVIPLWEPFVYCGRPFLALINGAALHPLISLMLLGVLAGLSHYQAYMVFILFYYFIGLFGFYVLSNLVLKSKFYALCAYVALMFSGMGLMVFNQIYVILIFVPSVWFFVFLLRFIKGFRVWDFCGLVVAVMLMEVSYYPFYLLSAFLAFSLVGLGGYFGRINAILRNVWQFALGNKRVVTAALAGLLISSMPLFLYKVRDQQQETISPQRHARCTMYADIEACRSGSTMSYDDVGFWGTLTERTTLKALIMHLDRLNYMDDHNFYIPIFCLILIMVSIFTKMDRVRLVVLFTGLILFFIAMGAATPVHRFLFNHVFYFQYFRNLFFMAAFLIPLVVLFSFLQLKAMLSADFSSVFVKKTAVVVLHVLIFLFLIILSNNIVMNYVTVMLSLLFFVAFYIYPARNRVFYPLLILIVILIQPCEVFSFYNTNAGNLDLSRPIFANHVKPAFEFQRPQGRDDSLLNRFRDFDFDANLRMIDSDGRFRIFPDSVTASYFGFLSGVGADKAVSFIHNKFYLYNDVSFYSESDAEVIEEIWFNITNSKNHVYVFDQSVPKAGLKRTYSNAASETVEIITRSSDTLNVKKFTVNEIVMTYSLSQPRFLLYTDSYTSEWQAFLDDKPIKIYRANVAFKGVELPAGAHSLKMVYAPPGGVLLYWGILGFLLLFTIMTVAGLLKNAGKYPMAGESSLNQSKGPDHSGSLSLSLTSYLMVFILVIALVSPQTVHYIRHVYMGQRLTNLLEMRDIGYEAYYRNQSVLFSDHGID